MNKLPLAALLVAAGILAGCVVTSPQQSTQAPTTDTGNERSITVNVPSGATQLRVDTSGAVRSGLPDVTVLVKDGSGNILGSHTWALKDRSSDTLTVDLAGQSQVFVIAKVIDGDASLDVDVTAVVPGQPEVVVVHQTIVITQTTIVSSTPSSTTTTSPTPTTVSSTPTPTTNTSTNSTNATNTTP